MGLGHLSTLLGAIGWYGIFFGRAMLVAACESFVMTVLRFDAIGVTKNGLRARLQAA